MKGLIFLVAIVLAAVSLTSQASAQELTVVVSFDPAAGELPEAVAVDGLGNAYLTMQNGKIVKVTPAGATSVHAQLPAPGPNQVITGLAFDNLGNLFVCYASNDPATHGIWLVRANGAASLFASLDPTGLPNWPALDSNGQLYVSDSVLGKIWKVTRQGVVSEWSSDPLLAGVVTPPLTFPVGTNGLAFDASGDFLYSANTSMGRIDRIPVLPDGTAGPGETFLDDPALVGGADDIAFDEAGTLYVAVIAGDRLVTVSPAGVGAILAEGPPLQNPSTVAFGAGATAGELLITNFGLLRALGVEPGTPEPALLSLDAAVAGILVTPVLPAEPAPAPTATTAPAATPAALPSTGGGSGAPTPWWPLALAGAALGAGGLLAVAARRRTP